VSERKLRQVRCPRCRKLADWYDNPHRPFCSQRCRILDLGAWADETYRIKGKRLSEDEKESDAEEEGEPRER
jgi:endogenous inhibitor of DNA gyrase (YacG/DUF329 family)